MRFTALTVATAALISFNASAQDSAVERAYTEEEAAPSDNAGATMKTYDKSGYHILNRTPKEQMRELASDRAMKMQSPLTLDAGHFQVEVGASHLTDETEVAGATITLTETTLGTTNIKVGLLNDVDLQLIHLGYVTRDLEIDKPTARDSESDYGLGDMVVRMKWNIWGNDGGDFAAALIPFAIIPSSDSGYGQEELAGGLAIPTSWKLLSWLTVRSLLEVDYLWNAANEEYYMVLASSMGISVPFTHWLSFFGEFYNTQSYDKNGEWMAQGHGGLIFTFAHNYQIDAGASVGITENAPDLNASAGITARF